MKTNNAGIALLRNFEQCRLVAYKDVGGVWTIGWGDTGLDVVAGMVITQEEADARLAERLWGFEQGVTHNVHVPVSDNQFSAMVCLAYNIGLGNFYKSSVLSLCNAGMYDKAADAFLLWNKVKGHVVPGLTRRREAERALFLTKEG